MKTVICDCVAAPVESVVRLRMSVRTIAAILVGLVLLSVVSHADTDVVSLGVLARFEAHTRAQFKDAMIHGSSEESGRLSDSDLEALAVQSARDVLLYALILAEAEGFDPEEYFSELGFDQPIPFLGNESLEGLTLFYGCGESMEADLEADQTQTNQLLQLTLMDAPRVLLPQNGSSHQCAAELRRYAARQVDRAID